MKLIVEGYNYQSEKARHIIELFSHKILKDGRVSTDTVGYCYSKSLQDCVFFAPKVICDAENRLLSKYEDLDNCVDVSESPLEEEEKRFVQGLNVWLYRALKRYADREESSEIIERQSFSSTCDDPSIKDTFLDNILAIIDFYEKNRDFFIFTMKNIHSQRHKINWNKTISQSGAIIQEKTPLYLDPISKKKSINWDEELLIVFFSILNYVNSFGFDVRFENSYELIKGDLFKAYLEGLGLTRLRQIKHRYFSDKTRKLWSLCHDFFAKIDSISSSKQDFEFLVANKFHIAFEDMVDELIGQPELADMRKLDDGKIIDHIYQDTSLLSADLIYYIGDSKYYKLSSQVKEESNSTYKQYTYARNIVHNSIIASFNNTWPFRDPLTEGYSITPNFFISAEIEENRRYDVDGFEKKDVVSKPFTSRQFNNRLFDRDTLWVNQYNLDFLYLLSVYASGNKGMKDDFKIKAHRFFRDKTIDLLNRKYEFWELKPKAGKSLEETLTDTIKWELRGMVYRLGQTGESLLFAMEKPADAEGEDNIIYLQKERQADFERVSHVIAPLFNYRRCLLSKKAGEVISYIEDKRSSGFFFFFFFFDEEGTSTND